MKLADALNGYKTSTRNLLLTNGELDEKRIELVYKLDQAAKTAEAVLAQESPFSVEITRENIIKIIDEVEEMEDRFRDAWEERVEQFSLLMNYCY